MTALLKVLWVGELRLYPLMLFDIRRRTKPIYIHPKCKWQGKSHDEATIDQEKLDEITDRINTAFWKLDMKIKEIA